MENLRDFLEVHSFLIGNKLTISIKEKTILDMMWRVKVLHNGKVFYEEKEYTHIKFITIEINDPGCWLIFIEAKAEGHVFSHIRDSIWYYTSTQKKMYKKFLSRNSLPGNENLPFAELRYPYQNLALICQPANTCSGGGWNRNIEKIDPELKLWESSIDGKQKITVISQQEGLETNQGTVFFSGKTKYHQKLIFGQDDIQYETDLKEILDEVGYFSAIHLTKNQVVVTNDYFGTYPLYSYESVSLCIVSNSFHLIVLLLKLSGIRLQLDVNHIIPYFARGEGQLFEQLASHQTFIREIRKMPICSKGFITIDGYQQVDKNIAIVMKSSMSYEEDVYKKLLKEYADEIVENIKIARNDARFSDVIIDVSGGKDSRVILGAALNALGNSDDRVKINSVDVTSKKDDKNSFIPLNHLHSFQYDNVGDTLQIVDMRKRLLERRSVYLGTLFSHTMPSKYERCSEQASRLQLTGAGGDMLLHADFHMAFPDINCESLKKLVDSFCRLYNNGIVNYKRIKPYIYNLIEEGIGEVIGTNPFERLNNYYLYFRNAYHFGPEVLFPWMETSREQWSPLYSKKGFLIRQMVSQKFTGIRFSLDLINELAPVLLKAPFSNQKYNRELETFLEKNPSLNKEVRNIKIDLNYDETQWIEAKKEKIESRNLKSSIEEQIEADELEKEIIDRFYESALGKLNKMLKYDRKMEKELGLDLYLKFKENETLLKHKRPSREFVFLYNKIESVVDLIDVIEEK